MGSVVDLAGLEAKARALDAKAKECDDEADHLGSISDQLGLRASEIFHSWKGTAANTLNMSIQEQITNVTLARGNLVLAAMALRSGADQLRAEIRREEEKRRREAAQRRREEEQSKQRRP